MYSISSCSNVTVAHSPQTADKTLLGQGSPISGYFLKVGPAQNTSQALTIVNCSLLTTYHLPSTTIHHHHVCRNR